MQIEDKIRHLIDEALASLNIEGGIYIIEHPAEIEHGDYASNVALLCAKSAVKKPKEVAKLIIEKIEEDESIDKIEIAGPGFINFHLSKKFYGDQLEAILNLEESWGNNNSNDGKKIMVEFTDPNPFKAFHIGHLMSNAIGESISRLIEFSGAEIKRANYQGDVGPHVAKAVWGLKTGHGSTETAEGLGKAYSAGVTAYEESADSKIEIDAINKSIYEKNNNEITELYEKGRKESLDHFEDIYKSLGTKFDYYFFESETWEDGIEIVKKNIGKVFEESEGAVVFHGEKYDKKLHTRVFLNSEGLPTYEAKELGLAYKKKETCDADLSITITAIEQAEYFKVVLKAIEQIDNNIASKMKHISHGMMKLSTGKMSSRKGEVITGEGLISSVTKQVLKVTKEREIKNEEKIAEKIAIAAIKYSILRSHFGNDIVFDLEKSLSFEGDSGPYLQYAHTRAQSILKKKNAGINAGINAETTSKLEKLLYRFPEVVKKAQTEYAPHHVTQYLTEVAGEFNSFYANQKIIGEENEEYNLALTKAFQITMQNGLYLLGIKAPEEM